MGISRLDRIGGPHLGINEDLAMQLAKAGRNVAYFDTSKDPVLYSPWRRSSEDVSLLISLDPAADTPNMRIDIWADYALIRFAAAIKKMLLKKHQTPNGIRLGIIWAMDLLASAVIRPLAFVAKLIVVSCLSIKPIIKTLWNLFIRMPLKWRVTRGFKNGLVGLVPLADLLIKPAVRFAIANPYLVTALVLGAVSLFVPVVAAVVFPFADKVLGVLANTAFPIVKNAIQYALSGKVIELTAGSILGGLTVIGAGLVAVGKYFSRQYAEHDSAAKMIIKNEENSPLLDKIHDAKEHQHSTQNTVSRSPQLRKQINQSLDKRFEKEPAKAERYKAAIEKDWKYDNFKIRRKDKDQPIDHSLVKMSGQHFLFDKTLGKGQCGTAKKALHLESGQTVVMKITKPSNPILVPIMGDIAANEARILRHLQKGPVMVWKKELDMESFEPDSLAKPANLTRAVLCHSKIYMTQPFEEGTPVETYLKENTLTIEQASLIMHRFLVALKKLHDSNVFHGDIKLENLLYHAKGEMGKFIDFGLAEIVDEYGMIHKPALVVAQPKANLLPRQVVGLFHQESPEWKKGDPLGLKTDIFAMGLALGDFLDKARIEGDLEAVYNFKQAMRNTLITQMTDADAGARPELNNLMGHPVFKQKAQAATAKI